jgi:16S rRNA (cytidine1402-2'-O)-methyltransferase
MNKGKLYLIPNIIAEGTQQLVITPQVYAILPTIQHFLVEDLRSARRYLGNLKIYQSIESLDFQLLNKDTETESLTRLFAPVFKGINIGIISEAGVPGVADPGSIAVNYAHANDVQVVPLVGPSSLLLALMASGLNGQRFAFHGYLPIDAKECSKAIRNLEQESRQRNQTQIFIETPYRNNRLMKLMVDNLQNETMLSIALDLTGPGEKIKTLPVKQWKTRDLQLPKTPAVFLFLHI